jgi:soluble lytic murein transglycosylase-like protein
MWLQLGRGLAAWLFFCLIASAQAQELKLDREALIRARAYEADLIETSVKYGLDPRLLWTIAYLETRFDPKLVSRKGARGLMQLMPATAARFSIADPHDPKAAIDAAARYVRYLMERFGGRGDLTLAAYNAGEGAVEAYLTGRSVQIGNRVINPARRITGGVPPYRETRGYVAAGLGILARFERSTKFKVAQRQANKERAEEETTSPPRPKSRSIIYVGPPDQTNSRRAKPPFRLSISPDNR